MLTFSSLCFVLSAPTLCPEMGKWHRTDRKMRIPSSLLLRHPAREYTPKCIQKTVLWYSEMDRKGNREMGCVCGRGLEQVWGNSRVFGGQPRLEA